MTRRDKRRRFSRWLVELFLEPRPAEYPPKGGRQRPILVEPLETRQLLAVDGFMPLLGSVMGDDAPTSNSQPANSLVGEGELVAEGEDTNDLVAFAKALADSGTRFFGAAWCPACTSQKALFGDGAQFLPFIEVTNPDRTPNQIAIDEGITEYPTWEFPDSTRVTGIQSLETIAQRSGVAIPQSSTPSFVDLPNVNVGIGSPLHIPVDAYDPNGNPLTITVSSSDPSLVTAEVLSGNRSLRLSTAGFGDMVFELFENRAPVPSGRVIALAESDFYNGISFHRVIDNFVIQGGDPTGTGAGGSTLGDFDDQFHLDLQHNGSGQLSYAKTDDDTNDSQFFITEGSERHLDFNHSVFGQLVEGELVREAISSTAVNASNRPINDVVIDSASIFTDTENGVIVLRPTGSGTGAANITVTVSDNEGNSTSQTFSANVVQDTANGAPFLNPVPTVQTAANTPVQVNLTSQDAEGDTVVYSVQQLGNQNFGLTVDSSTGVVTVTPPAGFTGQLQFLATVRQTTTPTTDSETDNQVVTVQVNQLVPTGLDLVSGSDSGSSSTDDITNAQTLAFTVSGTVAGALVEVRSGGTVVGSATATGTTTQVTVTDVASLGQGSRLFTATQTSGGQTSSESPSLAVLLDNVAPVDVNAGSIPASAVIDQQLSVNLDHSEEGQGLVYGISGAPTGMTIGAQDGQLNWTPDSTLLGPQTFTLTLTDAAGNVNEQQISINVIEEPLVKITLNAVDLNGAPITTVAAGETFKVQVIVEDLRPGVSATGVFATYADLLFDSNIIEPIATNPITHTPPYTNDASGSVATPGLVDELGAFSDTTSRLGSDARVLAEVTFLAKASGNPALRTEAPDEAGNDILLYDDTTAVGFSRVDFGASAFVVGANFEAVDDVFNFDEDSGPHSLNVLNNDTVTGGAVLTITEVGTASGGGIVTINSDNRTLSYTPAANFNGAESFTYTAENQDGIPLTATVTIQVADVNDPPVALNDTFSVVRNSSNNVLQVLLNDTSGVDASSADTLTVSAVSTGSAGGTITVGSSGLSVLYTPAAGFQGTETFTYTLSDGRGGTDTGTVSIAVDTQNPPPTPQNDNFTVQEDASQASFDVLANDTSDDPSETLTVSAVGTSQVGSIVSVASDGLSVLYQPAANFNGTEIITYTLRDSGGATANGLMTFTVNAVNDAPTAVDDSLTALSGDSSTTLDVLANDTNVDQGETLRITAVTQPPSGSGTIEIASDGRSLIYLSPSSTFEGQFSITYTIDDGTGLTDTATVIVDVRDFIPRAIMGRVIHGSLGSNARLGGVHLVLTGQDVTGRAVSEETKVAADGSFSFPGLAPGNYTLVREALPFLNDSGSSVSIVSEAADGDFVSDLLVTGSLRVGFFDIRDFLGSSVGSGLTVAVNADGTQSWLASRGDWTNLDTIDTQINASGSLEISAVNSVQQNLETTLDIPGTLVYQTGQEASMRLLRVRGGVSDAGLQPANSGGEGEASGSTLQAEGEGPEAAEVSTDSSVPAIPPAPVLVSATSSQTSSPTQAVRQLLGSTLAQRGDSAPAMSAEAVDTAMESALPALRLELSDDLQDALTADDDESPETNDEVLANL